MSIKRKGLLVVLSFILAMSTALIGCGGSGSQGQGSSSAAPAELNLVKEGTLTIGSDCDYPPFIWMEGAQPAGFEYDLLEAVAGKLGLKLEYIAPQNFDTILASITAGGKMDLGVSSFTINDERKQLVDFCTPYIDSNQAVVALKSNAFTDYRDLAGMTVGAQSGTTGQAWAEENIPDITMKTYTQTSEALAALLTGDIMAVVYDEPVAAYHVDSDAYSSAEIISSIATGEQYGMAVSKNNNALRDAVNKAMVELKADGTYDTIFLKHFPELSPPNIS